MRDYLNEYLSTQDNGFRNSSGLGYVIIKAKDDANREAYIKNCVLKGTVTIALENGGFVENVPILKHVWNDITFPELPNKLGSCVLWSNVNKSNVIVIVGVVPKNNEIVNRNENDFLLTRSFAQKIGGKNIVNNIEISGNAKEGKINITVDGGNDNGEMLINVSNKNNTAAVKINVKGKVAIDSTDVITINSKKSVTLGTGKDASKEGITLGKQAKKMFDDFIDQVSQITVTTALGTMPILNATQVAALKNNTEKIISKYGFTD